MLIQYIILVVILLSGMVWSIRARKLTFAGSLTGGVTGFLIFCGAGFTGLTMMTLFFMMGTAATSWKKM